jgi:hypothetical protein
MDKKDAQAVKIVETAISEMQKHLNESKQSGDYKWVRDMARVLSELAKLVKKDGK